MFRSVYMNHSISAISHFYNNDLPLPFSNTDFYINVIRNLFVNKTSSEIVQLGLVYDFTKDKSYMSVSITTKPHVKLSNLVDIKRFIAWFNVNYEELFFKHVYKSNDLIKTTYSYNDGFIRYAIILIESLNNTEPEQLIIEYKTLN